MSDSTLGDNSDIVNMNLEQGLSARRRPVGGTMKRVFDIAFAIVALLSFLPIFVVVALVVSLTSRGPIFFLHRRIGYDGRAFKCVKFRTMHVNGDAILSAHFKANPDAQKEYESTRKLAKDPRIIPGVGRILRKTSLDEIPQFLNVLLGQMSVVGPRPVTAEEIEDCYGHDAGQVLSARPGITGLWQVSGRNNLSYARRVSLDLSYVGNWSLFSDIKLIMRTASVVLTGKGAY